ncbi:MAG: TauD/TfdA family dioxygenase [Gammaproteobacteria bacterium]|nr:TauD/TfdA family dioxygenase [Gammaproteobacteria bacterium]
MTGLPKPFDGTSNAYQCWREHRLSLVSTQQANRTMVFSIDSNLKDQEILQKLCSDVEHHGFALYQFSDPLDDNEQRKAAVNLYAELGLADADDGVLIGADNLSLLENSVNTERKRFVPYSDRAMNWHTDGYYNAQDAHVRSFCLHCLQPAAIGGELTILDDELLLIALYDRYPYCVKPLTHPQAMLLPKSRDELGPDRPDRVVPVFSVDNNQRLLTRFTTRQRNIDWRDENTLDAARTASELLNQLKHWHTTLKLQAGQGIITRNILHCRTSFVDHDKNSGRKILRGRYQQAPNLASVT